MQPNFLQPGDTIGLCATARWVTTEQLQPALDLFQQWGYRVKVMPQVYNQVGQLAGNPIQRLEGLRSCLHDEEIKAVVVVRGGYGTVHIVDELTKEDLQAAASKWLFGYSDITVLHQLWNNHGIPTWHTTMPISFSECTEEALASFHRAINGQWKEQKWKCETTENLPLPYHNGSCYAPIVGGNLSVIYSQLGSPTQLETAGKILFLEDVDEMLYHLDRMIFSVRRAGLFDHIVGLIVGGFTQMRDNTKEFGFATDNPWGSPWSEIIGSGPSAKTIPVAFGYPAGHCRDNHALPLGLPVNFKVNEGYASISFSTIG